MYLHCNTECVEIQGMSGKTGAAAADTAVDADLEAMVQIMGRMFRGMKGRRAHEEAEELIGW